MREMKVKIMAFVSERIKEEDKEYFNSIGFMQLATAKPVRPSWWVIDKEREIIMTCRGGVFAEPIKGYQLYINKKFVDIELIEKIKGSYSKKKLTSHYEIKNITIPKKLIEDGVTVEKIKELISELFTMAGTYGYEPEVTMETKITMEAEPIVV